MNLAAPPPPHEANIYHKLSHLYEGIFAPFFMRRVHSTIRGLNIPRGARVLEVGVGTGLALPAYPEHAEVTAIDLSDEMLLHARQKIEQHDWQHIEVRQMDALELEFEDESFDYVLAFHLVTVVPDCHRLMHEMTRVCKPGGTIVIINHFRSPRPWIAGMVDCLNPLTNLLGWRTTLKYEELVEPAPIKIVRRFKTAPQSLFTVVIAQKMEDERDN